MLWVNNGRIHWLIKQKLGKAWFCVCSSIHSSIQTCKSIFMEVLKKIWGYLTLKKRNPDDPNTFNLRMMHGINKISILMFVIGITYVVIRNVFFR
jgi:hypothetical protein